VPPAAPVEAATHEDGGLPGDQGQPVEGTITTDAGRDVFQVHGLQRPSQPKVERPAKAVEQGIFGDMIVRCTIMNDGSIHSCCVRKGLPYMDRAIVDQLQSSRVRPLYFQRKPANVEYTWTFRFRPSPSK